MCMLSGMKVVVVVGGLLYTIHGWKMRPAARSDKKEWEISPTDQLPTFKGTLITWT